jgi:hypothetical protein
MYKGHAAAAQGFLEILEAEFCASQARLRES